MCKMLSNLKIFTFQESLVSNIDTLFLKNDYLLWNVFLNSFKDFNTHDLERVKVELFQWFIDNVSSFKLYPKPGLIFILRKLRINNVIFKYEDIITHHLKYQSWILDELPKILTLLCCDLDGKELNLLFLECINFLQDLGFDQDMSLAHCTWIAQCFTALDSNFVLQYHLVQFMDTIIDQLDMEKPQCLEICANSAQVCIENYLSRSLPHTKLDFTKLCLIHVNSHDVARELYAIGLRVLTKSANDNNDTFFKLFQDFQTYLCDSIESHSSIEECIEIVCGGDDDMLILSALCHLKLWLLELKSGVCCPYRMAWLIVVKNSNCDSTLLLDWLTAPETAVLFLEYLLRLVKLLIVQFFAFLRALDHVIIVKECQNDVSIDCFMGLLIRIRMSLERLYNSEILQFNPQPLTRQIRQLEEVYECHSKE